MRPAGIISTYALLGALLIWTLALGEAGYASVVGVLLLGLTLVLYADFSKLKVGGGGFGVQAERSVEAILDQEDAVEEAASEFERAAQLTPEEWRADQLEEATKQEAEQRRRDHIERLVLEAARLGFGMARIGLKRPPHPLMTWTPEGNATISYDVNADEFLRARRQAWLDVVEAEDAALLAQIERRRRTGDDRGNDNVPPS